MNSFSIFTDVGNYFNKKKEVTGLEVKHSTTAHPIDFRLGRRCAVDPRRSRAESESSFRREILIFSFLQHFKPFKCSGKFLLQLYS